MWHNFETSNMCTIIIGQPHESNAIIFVLEYTFHDVYFYLLYQHMSLKNNGKRRVLEIGTVEVSKQLINN